MNDLISKSSLLQVLKYHKAIHEDENGETRQLIAVDINQLIEYVEKMPTDYDVDKVVEQIRSEAKLMSEAQLPHKCYKAIGTRRARAIIRKGGKE